MTKASRN